MKRMIVVEIDCEDEGCGECELQAGPGCRMAFTRWSMAGKEWKTEDSIMMRGPLCLEAERKLRALVEAGVVLRNLVARGPSLHDLGRASEYVGAWDAAVRELEGKP